MNVMDRLRMDGGGDDETPSVAMPSRPWVLPLGLGAAILLGGAVFWQLNANRARVEEARLTDPMQNVELGVSLEGVPPAPDLLAFSYTEGATQAVVESGVPPATPPAPPSPDVENRLRSPSMVVDLSQPGASGTLGTTASTIAQAAGGGAGGARNADRNADEDFASRLGVNGAGPSARAQRMSNQAYTVAEGALIPAVLETAIHSDLPGYARAVVSRDVRSFDGANVLVPRGSRLVGQYRSGVALGQSRAFVIWTRLIRPDGVSIELSAPGTDALGRGGLEGRVDRHFLQRFGGAILLSLISAGASLATEESDTQVIIASSSGAAGSAAAAALESDLNIAPTVEVAQGAPIRVFVTRDLDFSILNELE